MIDPKVPNFSAQVVGFELGFLYLWMRDSRSKALTFESPTSRVISRNPMVGDPSEAEHVYVGTSRGKNAGEGLFAKRDIKVRTDVSLGYE